MNRRLFFQLFVTVAAAVMTEGMSIAKDLPRKKIRLSAEKGDPGYDAWRAILEIKKPIVYLDGKVVEFAITADERTGYVKRGLYDKDGQPIIRADRFATEELHGHVRIELVDRH